MKAFSFLQSLRNDEDSIKIGKQQSIFSGPEGITEAQLNHHVHVVGASGYGKTVLLSHIIQQRIFKNKGVLFIDLKGDIETIDNFKSFAHQAGRADQVSIFSLSNSEISKPYNLVEGGTATQLRDKIIQAFNWTEEFYMWCFFWSGNFFTDLV